MTTQPDPSQDELWLAMREAERAATARISELAAENQSLRAQLDAVYASTTWTLGRRVIGLAQPAVRARRWLRVRRSSPAAIARSRTASDPSTTSEARATPGPDAGPLGALETALQRSIPPFDDQQVAPLTVLVERTRRHSRAELLADELTAADRSSLLELETALALGSHASPPGTEPSSAADAPGSSAERAVVVVDARRLQSPWTASDTSRSHALAVLDALRDVAGDGEVVALLDPVGGALDPAAAALVDRVVFAPRQVDHASVALFVSLGPMDHTLCPAAPFIDAAAIASAAVLTETIAQAGGAGAGSPPPAIARAARLHGLSRYDLALVVTADVAADAGRSLGWPSERLVVTDVSARSIHAPPPTAPPGGNPFVVADVGTDGDALTAMTAFAVAVRPPRPPARELRLLLSGPLTTAGQVEVRRLAADLGLDDRVELRPAVAGPEARSLVAGAVAALLPAPVRGFPLLALDAIEAGCPVVATDGLTARDILGTGGWLAATEADGLGQALRSVLLQPHDVAAAQRAHAGSRFSPDAVRDRIVQGLRTAVDHRAGEGAGVDQTAGTVAIRPTVAVLVPDLPPGPARATAAMTVSALTDMVRVVVHAAGGPSPDLGGSVEPLDCRPFLDAGNAAVLGFVDDDPSSRAVIEYLTSFGGAGFVLGRQVPIEELSKVCTPLLVEDEEEARRIQQGTLRRPALIPRAFGALPDAVTIDDEARRQARAAVAYADGRLHLARFGALTGASSDLAMLPGALAWLVGWGHDTVLHVIGDVDPEAWSRLEDAMSLLGLERRVIVHQPDPTGRVQHLLAADVAVQIDSGRAETSKTILECISHGLPTVRVDDGDQPGGSLRIVESLPDRTSPLLLAESIDRLSSLRADDLDAIERERLVHLRAHSPAHRARRLVRSLGLEAEGEGEP